MRRVSETAAEDIWREVLPNVESPPLRITGSDEQLPSLFAVERLAGATVGAALMSASAYRALRDGAAVQGVSLDMREIAVAFCSEQYLRVNGAAQSGWAPLSGDYAAADGRYVRLHCNFPQHAAAAARALECDETKEAFVRAVARREAFELEESVLREGGAAGAARTIAEWRDHPHRKFLRDRRLVAVGRYGDAPPVLRERPLRVLDLTRVIAGPLAGKVLAAYGADVLHIGSSDLPTIPALEIDHGFGKRSLDLDLRRAADAEKLRALISEADIFLESYRPGALDALGFGFDDVRLIRPDIVYVSLSAYGREGPWGGRRGFDSVVQLTGGIACIDDAASKPRPLPCQALDHASGYLAAFGAAAACIRRASEGGAWHVEASLARTAERLWEFGLHDHLAQRKPALEDVADLMRAACSVDGELLYVPVPGRYADASASRPGAWFSESAS